jgi:hypothetical protein
MLNVQAARAVKIMYPHAHHADCSIEASVTGDMILGFTGSRHRVTSDQIRWMGEQLADATELHHGACVCADEIAHKTAVRVLTGRINVVVHPPTDGRWMMEPDWNHPNVTLLPHKHYHARNRDIVHASDRLIALPLSPERIGGGTWYTVNYATGKIPVAICYPDGTLEYR